MKLFLENHIVKRASYIAEMSNFHRTETQAILGQLAQGQSGDLNPAQRDAWVQQIEILKQALPIDLAGIICFEFVIPRIGKRVDNVLLVGDQVMLLEFKVGSDTFDQSAITQVVDYALDLKNFHVGSHQAIITPIVVATHAPRRENLDGDAYDGIYPPLLANSDSLAGIIQGVVNRSHTAAASHQAWLAAGYKPTPTIVEASQALYRGHKVEEITHSEAGADNLGATTVAISRIIEQAKLTGRKAICLVSGVPGAGKTLAGLNLVCQRRHVAGGDQEHAVFLSGNGPLVNVLQEALARDEVVQAAERGQRLIKNDALRHAHTFIQNIHHFRDECLKDTHPPVERVVVFDEAQRAWNKEQTSKFMRTKRGQVDFDQSEPAFLISVMDRHPAWAVIVCLIGGGQEINTGEAGLEEWLRALRDRFPQWQVHVSDKIEAADYLPTFKLADLGDRIVREPSLHLGVSLRSFRSEKLSAGIAALMSGNGEVAKQALAQVLPKFPIVITRSIPNAKAWVRARARGSERFGMLASSGGKRLKPLGVTMDVQIEPCVWFLNHANDVRSSYYLEDAASEFDVQGLELDWTIVVWDGDLIHQPPGWRYRAFKGTKWQEIRGEEARQYRLNAYRVLLTRARQGMVIVVPEGDPNDPTRAADYYDPTWEYLKSIGIPVLL